MQAAQWEKLQAKHFPGKAVGLEHLQKSRQLIGRGSKPSALPAKHLEAVGAMCEEEEEEENPSLALPTVPPASDCIWPGCPTAEVHGSVPSSQCWG